MTRRAVSILAIVALSGAGALAQRALDANTNVLGGRRNPTNPGVTMSRPIYKVNQRTGEMVYNRAVAFNDPAYNIYQYHTISKFDTSAPVVQPRGIPGVTMPSKGYTRPLQGGNPNLRASNRSALATPKYSASRGHGGKRYTTGAGRASSLKQPTYRVSGNRRR